MGFGKFKEGIKAFNKRALRHFINKQGFYIVLFVCICVITATALWTSGNIGNGILGKNEGKISLKTRKVRSRRIPVKRLRTSRCRPEYR